MVVWQYIQTPPWITLHKFVSVQVVLHRQASPTRVGTYIGTGQVAVQCKTSHHTLQIQYIRLACAVKWFLQLTLYCLAWISFVTTPFVCVKHYILNDPTADKHKKAFQVPSRFIYFVGPLCLRFVRGINTWNEQHKTIRQLNTYGTLKSFKCV